MQNYASLFYAALAAVDETKALLNGSRPENYTSDTRSESSSWSECRAASPVAEAIKELRNLDSVSGLRLADFSG